MEPIPVMQIIPKDYKTLKTKVDLYEKALTGITKHAYKGIVMQLAHKALSDAKELK